MHLKTCTTSGTSRRAERNGDGECGFECEKADRVVRSRGWQEERWQARLPDPVLFDQTQLYSLEGPSIRIKQQLRKALGEGGELAPALCFSHLGFLGYQQQSVRAKFEGFFC